MEYQPLTKLYYKDRSLYKQECTNRRTSVSSINLNIRIKNNEAFYVNCPQITEQICAIYQNLNRLKRQIRILPEIAYDCYARNCLIDEVLLTNDIEGVYSTKKEIRDILNAQDKASQEKRRLQGLVRKYAKLSDSTERVPLNSSGDIRLLYDEIVADEVENGDLPDGEIFRKGEVSVVTVTDKIKHKGVAPPEKNIIDAMDAALRLLSSTEVPDLISISLLHYFMGYVHPFYDGNGRLSRFISSYLLRQSLDLLISLRLSYSIKNNKKKYYEAFDIVNDEKSIGDVTPFIIMFLNIIIDSETSLISKLEGAIEKMDYYRSLLERVEDGFGVNDDHLNMIFALIQNKLFDSEPFDINSLGTALKISSATARRRVDEITASALGKFLTVTRDGHRYRYSIDLDGFDEFATAL